MAPTVVDVRVLYGNNQSFDLNTSTRTDLPWAITGIQVVFSEAIGSASLASVGGLSATSLSGLNTNVLTWNINALTQGNFSAILSGIGANGLRDEAGNLLAGGNFVQSFQVLQGDFNDDGVVNSTDMLGVYFAMRGPYNVFADLNGDGKVDLVDVQIARQHNGPTL